MSLESHTIPTKIVQQTSITSSSSNSPVKIGSPDTNNFHLQCNSSYPPPPLPLLYHTSHHHFKSNLPQIPIILHNKDKDIFLENDDGNKNEIYDTHDINIIQPISIEISPCIRCTTTMAFCFQIFVCLFVTLSAINYIPPKIENGPSSEETQLVTYNEDRTSTILVNVGYWTIYLNSTLYTGFIAIGKNPMQNKKIIVPLTILSGIAFIIQSAGIGMAHFYWIWHSNIHKGLPHMDTTIPIGN
jgi:hypothetical protein